MTSDDRAELDVRTSNTLDPSWEPNDGDIVAAYARGWKLVHAAIYHGQGERADFSRRHTAWTLEPLGCQATLRACFGDYGAMSKAFPVCARCRSAYDRRIRNSPFPQPGAPLEGGAPHHCDHAERSVQPGSPLMDEGAGAAVVPALTPR